MKKNIYLICIAVITIGCIIFGAYYNTRKISRNFQNGIKELKKSLKDGNFSFDFSDLDDWDDEIQTNQTHRFSTNLDEFQNVNLDLRFMEVTIKAGDNYHLHSVYSREELKPKYEIIDGTLNITQGNSNHKFNNNNCSLVLTVPKYTQLNDIDITLNMGELTLQDLDCTNIKVLDNMGEININNLNFEMLDAKTNMGEIDIHTLSPIEEYTIEAKTSMGEISIKQSVNGNYSHESMKSSFTQKGTTSKKMVLETNMGEIDIR